MTAKKEAAPVLAYRNGKEKMSKGKSSICILSLTRVAVKLAITADLVLLLAALGSLNIPASPVRCWPSTPCAVCWGW